MRLKGLREGLGNDILFRIAESKALARSSPRPLTTQLHASSGEEIGEQHMDTLIITPYLPYPLHGGAPTRMYHMIEGLSNRNHSVTLLTGLTPSDPSPKQTPLSDITCEIHTFPVKEKTSWSWLVGTIDPRPHPAARFSNRKYKSKLRGLARDQAFDLVLANFLFMADEPTRLFGTTPVVLDQHEDEERHWRSYLSNGRLHERIFAGISLAKLTKYRPRIFSRLSVIAAVSESEAQEVREQLTTDTPVWTVPNGVETERYQPTPIPSHDKETILFVGGMGVERNADAATWFAESIFPEVRLEHPSARFFIVGSNPLPKVKALDKEDDIVVTGTVPDVRPYYEQASVVVVPQRFGAGTKLKVLETMAVGRPLVSTSNGAQGIDIHPNEHFLLADDSQEFVSKICHLLKNPDQAKKLAENARIKAVQKYSWSRITRDLDELLRHLIHDRQGTDT